MISPIPKAEKDAEQIWFQHKKLLMLENCSAISSYWRVLGPLPPTTTLTVFFGFCLKMF